MMTWLAGRSSRRTFERPCDLRFCTLIATERKFQVAGPDAVLGTRSRTLRPGLPPGPFSPDVEVSSARSEHPAISLTKRGSASGSPEKRVGLISPRDSARIRRS